LSLDFLTELPYGSTPQGNCGTSPCCGMRTARIRWRMRDRSITLMHVFLLVSGGIMLVAAVVLSLVLGTAVRNQASSDIRADLSHVTTVALASGESGDILADPIAARTISKQLLRDPNVAGVEILREGSEPAETTARDQVVYQTPLRTVNGQTGYLRVVSNPVTVVQSSSHIRFIWVSVSIIFAALFALLVLLVRGASHSLQRRRSALQDQSEALMEAYERLEQSSLEAIESLNATVDAKDPSTAGHSQRVVEIALRIGRELRLDPKRLEVLRLGALFHDIGKLAVPDAILLKPGRLTRHEFEVIKRHCEDGARIVDRFGPLRPVVSIIRHHHERWSGHGYPAGLKGRTIPMEASIVGLADAWDAMTTNRPYKPTLSVAEAREEVETCSGTQFRPDVVDAFVSVLERDPAIFTPLEAEHEAPPKKRRPPLALAEPVG
jgi:putative nucleotidyltransferase with HDIG domain